MTKTIKQNFELYIATLAKANRSEAPTGEALDLIRLTYYAGYAACMDNTQKCGALPVEEAMETIKALFDEVAAYAASLKNNNSFDPSKN